MSHNFSCILCSFISNFNFNAQPEIKHLSFFQKITALCCYFSFISNYIYATLNFTLFQIIMTFFDHKKIMLVNSFVFYRFFFKKINKSLRKFKK